VIVERALADSDCGRDGVDADRADAVEIEQPVGGLQDPLFHVGFGLQGSHASRETLVP